MNNPYYQIILMLLFGVSVTLGAYAACGDDDDDDDENGAADDDADDDTGNGTDDDNDTAADDDESADDDEADDDTTLPNGPGGFDPGYRAADDFFTLMDGLTIGQEGLAVQIWYSTNIQPLVDLNDFLVPFGTTAIQEVDQNGDGTVDVLVVMVKREETYDPANNNWYYETRNPDGALRALPSPGRIQNCIECHRAFTATDYLGGTKLR